MRQCAFAFLLLALGGCSPTSGSPAVYEDWAMQNAVTEARGTLQVFFDVRESENAAFSDFRVTVILPSSANGRDYKELSDIRQEFAGFIGETLAGKEVLFLTADIADWRFKDGDRYRGSYTRRVMFDMTDANILNLRARFHEEPLP